LLAGQAPRPGNQRIRDLEASLHWTMVMKSSIAQGARVDPADFPRFNPQPITSIDSPNPTTYPTGSLGLKLFHPSTVNF
jgi:hypothetical protein